MDLIESTFINFLKMPDNKRLMARYLMTCAAELKKAIPDFDVKSKTIKDMVLLSIEHKIDSCKFLVGMSHLYGLFGVEKSYGKAYRYLNEYKDCLQDNKEADEIKLILAQLKYQGLGTVQSHVEAFEMLQSVEDQENDKLNVMMAEMYFSGLGVEQNYAKAFELISKHASSTIQGSFYLQGLMFVNGYGVEKDVRKGIQIIWSEATKGCCLSQNFVGQMYEHGDFGLEKDVVKAAQWYKKSAAQGLAVASMLLSNLESRSEAAS